MNAMAPITADELSGLNEIMSLGPQRLNEMVASLESNASFRSGNAKKFLDILRRRADMLTAAGLV